MAEFYGDPSTSGSSGGDPDPSPPSVTVDTTTTLVTGTINGKDWHGRAAIKRLNDDTLVLCWRDGSAHDVNDGALHIKFSDDNGATWSDTDKTIAGASVIGFPMNPSTLSAGQDAGEPWLYHMPGSDRLILHMWRVDYGVSQGGTWQSESDDGGATWSTSHGPVTFYDPTATSSTYLRSFATDDDFVDPVSGDLYALCRIHTSSTTTFKANFVLVKTTDEGDTWSRVGTGSNPRVVTSSENGGYGVIEGGMEYLGSSKIIVMLRDGQFRKSFQRVSTDMGGTWGPLIDVTSSVGIAARQRVYTAAHIRGEASWETDTNLIMTGFIQTVPGNSQGRRNAIWLSTDAGDTWSAPQYIDTANDDGGYGDLFWEGSAGKYGVVSYRGVLTSADLKQYDLTITGIG